MAVSFSFLHRKFLFLSVLAVATVSFSATLNAAALKLAWQDNSTDEDGFKIERKSGSNFVEIATVGANVESYTDSGLPAGATYCYRVRAFNSGGVSSPSNEFCATTPTSSPTNFTLDLTKSGPGTGTVTSSPAGINCGGDCSESYASGTKVSLIATPASGSTFVGWSGDPDCKNGIVTLDSDKSCTASFKVDASKHRLTVKRASSLASGGGGDGKVKSSPAGINCGSDCSEVYPSGKVVTLKAIPSGGSTFLGWSGDPDCSDGKVKLDADKICTATFAATTADLDLVKRGKGKVTSEPTGIDCGSECSKTFAAGTTVTISATPAVNSRFVGWSGGGCEGQADCVVSLDAATSVTASFVTTDPSAIGIFRPATGAWFLDANRNGVWEGCGVDFCLGPFGENGDVPLVGDWTGTGISAIGVYRPSTGAWLLDLNRNGRWDGCEIDRCLTPYRRQALTPPELSTPVVGDWTGVGVDMIGAMITEQTTRWHLDSNGSGSLDHCKTDACFDFTGNPGDVPLSADWTADGTAKVGVYRPATGEWFLDINGNGQWDDCNGGTCLQPFGAADDVPVAGKWTGTGVANVGLFRPATGEWFLDLNGNGQWDGCEVDGCYPFVGHNEGDLPVVGIW